jgi:hypothetical protein
MGVYFFNDWKQVRFGTGRRSAESAVFPAIGIFSGDPEL